MHRRDLFKALPALAAAAQLGGQAPMKCLLRTGLVAYSFRRQMEAKKMSYEDLIRMVAELGLDGLDTTVYWFPDTSDAYLASLRAAAYKNAVSLYSIAVRVSLCQPTAELQQAECEKVKKWLDVAERLGAGHIRVFGGSIPKGAGEEQAIGWAAEVLKRCAPMAAEKGIVLGVEDDGGLTTNAGPTVEIVKRANSPAAGVCLDTGNFPKDGYAQSAMCVPHTVNVHLKASIRGTDGQTEQADWDRLGGMLAAAGYRGYLSIEYEDREESGTAVPRLAAELKRVARKYSA